MLDLLKRKKPQPKRFDWDGYVKNGPVVAVWQASEGLYRLEQLVREYRGFYGAMFNGENTGLGIICALKREDTMVFWPGMMLGVGPPPRETWPDDTFEGENGLPRRMGLWLDLDCVHGLVDEHIGRLTIYDATPEYIQEVLRGRQWNIDYYTADGADKWASVIERNVELLAFLKRSFAPAAEEV